jgi:GNAT superfamily N-acetyltransferase
MHPDYADPVRRAALYRLFDRTWTNLAGKIETAARFGWNWDEITTPFARYQNDVALAHVGVIDLPVLLDGVEHRIAGVHAVCTDPDHRRQGHYRAVMEPALRFVDEHWSIAKLSTSQPELYEPFGFRVIEQHRFVLGHRHRRDETVAHHGEAAARRLDANDLPWLHELLVHRAPISRRFASRDPGWLLGIDEVLWTGGLSHLYEFDDAVVAWEVLGEELQIYDLVAKERDSTEWRGNLLHSLLAACPWSFERVVFWFTPDLVAPQASPISWAEDDFLMVRGPWPVGRPLAISPLAAH